MIELLSTKLFIPRPRSNLVLRPRLTERLNSGLEKKLTLIAAPAGSGKTTLLSEWIPQCPRCVTWFSLDEGDNDATRFWSYLITSLEGLRQDLGSSALNLLQSPQPPPITSILTALINDLTGFPDSFCMVLDDYHEIVSQQIHEAMRFLIAHLPANMHLVLTTRADPPFPLARLRGRDKLNELRVNDLRFSADEAAAFLIQVMQINLSGEEIAALEARTEGWIAGLQIAALSMQGQADPQKFIRGFSGSHRHILGYLADEVIDQRPKGTLNFLLQTSILDRLCGPLCDAVTEGGDGQTMLEDLARSNLFIMPLDDEGRWYRYHRLFAEVLQARLRRAQPERVQELHRRAVSWLAQHGMTDEAMSHAIAGEDFEQAAVLIESQAGAMLRRGSSVLLKRWLDAMPEETILAHPRLCLGRAWICFMGPVLNLEKAERWAQMAIQVAQANGSEDRDLFGEVAALGAMIAITRGEALLSRDLAQQALDELTVDSPWRGAVAFSLGTAYLESGDTLAAAQAFNEAIKLSQAPGDHYVLLAAASFLADIFVLQGHLDQAMQTYRQVLAWTDTGLPQKGSVMALGGLAAIYYERDQLNLAMSYVQQGEEQVDQVGGVWAAFTIDRVVARMQQAQGHWKEALNSLTRAYRNGQSGQVSQVIGLAAAQRADLYLAQGNLEAAKSWAANSGIAVEDEVADHPGWREKEYLSLARVLAAQGRYTEASSLLERLKGSAEIEGRYGSMIAILVLQATIHQAQGGKNVALEHLERALILAAPESYVRIFIDEGESIHGLLDELRPKIRQNMGDHIDSASIQLLSYTEKLLAAFSRSKLLKESMDGTRLVPLSEREKDILRLIASGRTNQEIAEILVIALSTVKSHINRLYDKLGTQRRTQAILLAQERGLLSDKPID